jgi:hypothetical protein
MRRFSKTFQLELYELVELGPVKGVSDVSLIDWLFLVNRRTNYWELVIVYLIIEELGEALCMEHVFTLVKQDHFVFSPQL